MDDDLDALTHAQLLDEARRMRRAIRQHRDASGHELCWHHPDLWAMLPDKAEPAVVVPEWPQFMRGCVRYRASLDSQAPLAPRSPEEFSSDE